MSAPPADLLHAIPPTLIERLRAADLAHGRRYPGERQGSLQRQPIHTVYGGAHLFSAGTARRLGELALRALDQHAPDAASLAEALGIPDGELARAVHARVRAKLGAEPVEDYRIDFEDGYGERSDEEEDGHARRAGAEVAAGHAAGSLPPFIGLRVKPLTEERRGRAARTLELFFAALLEGTGGALPPGLLITLPKVQHPAQVEFLAALCAELERRHGLTPGALRFELMIETPQALLDGAGRAAAPALVAAGDGRCVAAHFGTYDYTASLGITAGSQRPGHPACDLARQLLQLSLAGSGVWLSDGATTLMPVGDRASVHRAWRVHGDSVRRALDAGFYQGWDLHPAQLPARYAAVYAFFIEGLPAATARLRSFLEQAARASRVGDAFDDAATGQGLLNYFLRGVACGALSADDVVDAGLSLEELRGRSFLRILEGRRG